jgi:O-antigen ligase
LNLKTIYLPLTAVFITILFFSELFIPVFVCLIFLFTYKMYGYRAVLFTVIVSSLVLTSTISEKLRLAVQLVILFSLILMVIKKNGLNFSNYAKLPKLFSTFLILYYCAMFISTLLSANPEFSLQQILRQSTFFFIVYALYNLIEDKRDVQVIIGALVFSGFIYIVSYFFYLYQMNFDIIDLSISQFNKAQSGYIDNNNMASLFLIIFSLIVTFLFKYKKGKVFNILVVCLLVTLIAIFFINSRAAYISIFFSMFFLFYNLNRKYLRYLLYLVIFSAGLLLVPVVNNFIQFYFRFESVTTGRDWITEIIWVIIKDNFIFGYGPGGTKPLLYTYLPYMLGGHEEYFLSIHWDIIDFGHAHNFYLYFLSDLGILGLFVSLFLPYTFFKIGFTIIKKLKTDGYYYYLVIAIMSAGVGLFVRGIFEWSNILSYGTLTNDLPFWLFIALLIFIYNKVSSQSVKNLVHLQY